MTVKPRHRAAVRWPVLVTTALAVSLLTAGWASGAGKPRAWFDQPLPGMTVGLGPVPVTIHAAFDSGVSAVRFLVDGESMAIVGAPAGDLVTVEWSWTPVSVGQHVITAVAVGGNGMLSSAVSVGVTVVPRDQLPPTPEPSTVPSGGPSPGPGQTGGPGPTLTPGPGPTPTTPGATFCSPPLPIVDQPTDYIQLDYPSQAQPLFKWHYSGSTGCLASQVLYIYNFVVGVELTIELGPGARSYQQRSDLPWDPDNPVDQCAHYQWYVTALNADGDGEQGAPGAFQICELNPDA